MPPASWKNIGEAGVEDADGEDDGEEDQESGDLAFAELVVGSVLSCHSLTLRG
jgi:hypothetical protein